MYSCCDTLSSPPSPLESVKAFPSLFPSFCAREPKVWLGPLESKWEILVIFWASFEVNDKWNPWHWAAFLVPLLPDEVKVVLPHSHALFLCGCVIPDGFYQRNHQKVKQADVSQVFHPISGVPVTILAYSPAWTHPSRCHCHASFANILTAWLEHLYWACQQNRHQNSIKKQKSSPLWLLQTSWSRAELWCFASLLSITQWWLLAGNLWIWTSKREQEWGQVRCASCAFHTRLFRVGVSKGYLIIFFPSLLLWWHWPVLNQTQVKTQAVPIRKEGMIYKNWKIIKDGTYFTDGDWSRDWETCLKFHRA